MSLPGEVLVRVEGVSKKFCKDMRTSLWYGVQDLGSEVFGRTRGQDLRPKEFWALKDVNFELRRGECLGLIGRNGAGKTTLLRMLNGLIKPDQGRIEMHGRIGALIALGSGFNPILSGRENIYVNAAVLGLSRKEVDLKMDEIIDFAEIGDFIDAPVQNYSSGMSVRLGFAIATSLEPDVLILDEVLAVGDAAFRHKCYHRIAKLMSRTAVILVSHSMDHIGATCNSVMLMRKGRPTHFDDPAEGISAYYTENESSGREWEDGGKVEAFYPPVVGFSARIPASEVRYGGRLTVEVTVTCDQDVFPSVFSFTLMDQQERPVMCWNSSRRTEPIHLRKGVQLVRFHIDPLLLHEGLYIWNFSITRSGTIEHLVWLMRAGEVRVSSAYRPLANIPYLPDPSGVEVEVLHQGVESSARSVGNDDPGRLAR